MKYLTVAAAFLIFAQFSTCFQVQNANAEVSGRVTGVRGRAPAVDVVLYDVEEGVQVAKTTSNQNAVFHFDDKVKPGEYELRMIHPQTGAQVYSTKIKINRTQDVEFVEIPREDLDI